MLTFARSVRTVSARTALIVGALGLGLLMQPAQAQQAPQISPSLKKILGELPIGEAKDQIQGMVGALKQTACGSGLSGCYMTQSGPLQLYLFSSKSAQQTVLAC